MLTKPTIMIQTYSPSLQGRRTSWANEFKSSLMNKTNFIREKKRNENKAEWKKNKEIYEQYKGKKTGKKNYLWRHTDEPVQNDYTVAAVKTQALPNLFKEGKDDTT